jgi:hypothetical protein
MTSKWSEIGYLERIHAKKIGYQVWFNFGFDIWIRNWHEWAPLKHEFGTKPNDVQMSWKLIYCVISP